MAATDTVPGAATGARGEVPPILLFLPGGATQPWNTTARLAEIFRRDLTRGPGRYAVQAAEPIDAQLLAEVLEIFEPVKNIGHREGLTKNN